MFFFWLYSLMYEDLSRKSPRDLGTHRTCSRLFTMSSVCSAFMMMWLTSIPSSRLFQAHSW